METKHVLSGGTKGVFKRSLIAEVIEEGGDVLTVIPHGSEAEIISIIPLHLNVTFPGEDLPVRVRMHQPSRLGEVLEITYLPPIGKIV